MEIRNPISLLFAVVLAGAPALGMCAEPLPIYNYDQHCRAVSGGDFDKDLKCGESEAAAYAKLEKSWASVPEQRKAECHNVAYDPDTGKGSYALHLQCIEKGRKSVSPRATPEPSSQPR